MTTPERAILFVDGSNWFHGLREINVPTSRVSYPKVCHKLLGPRTWSGLRWYVGKLDQASDVVRYSQQRQAMDALQQQDPKISVHYGRIEVRRARSSAAEELETYLGGLRSKLPADIYGHLYQIARTHRNTEVYVEKAVDVMLAVDMVSMALSNDYDAAYLLSADGDFTHAVEVVRSQGKKVYGVTALDKHLALKGSCNAMIHVKSPWFSSVLI